MWEDEALGSLARGSSVARVSLANDSNVIQIFSPPPLPPSPPPVVVQNPVELATCGSEVSIC